MNQAESNLQVVSSTVGNSAVSSDVTMNDFEKAIGLIVAGQQLSNPFFVTVTKLLGHSNHRCKERKGFSRTS